MSIATSAVSSAIAIARAAGLNDWLQEKFAGRPSLNVATRILELAEAATATSDPQRALEHIKNRPEERRKLQVMAQQWQHQLVKMHYDDLRDARGMYAEQSDNADRIARQIMSWNLPAIVALVGANCAAVYLIENPTIAVALGNIIGASITYLWNERSQVVGFFFGSSLGSKSKQDLLASAAALPRETAP
jgi:hypothetical protein